MQISVLSGKGGTGKTTIATNLAVIMGGYYVDCDVEEPNGFIFLKPNISKSKDVSIPTPQIDYTKCTLCKKCVQVCQFNALGIAGNQVLVFEKLCHGCGACLLACPDGAISEKERAIGKIDAGQSGELKCLQGVLNVGEPMAGPIIRDLKEMVKEESSLIDCSPGSSCNVVKAISGAHYAILVTEPTAFGLHDLKIAVELVRKLKLPFGLIINRGNDDNRMIIDYCEKEKIRLLGVIPFDRRVAEIYSRGNLLIEDEHYREIFEELAENIREVVRCS
ncbi:MAG: ATP-binding protein [Desulfitobacteriaceae bacterium]|nr:ATP-binding protein [Desulfitobacteriaceae bacterium]